MEKNKTKAGVFKFTAKKVPPITPNKINKPNDLIKKHGRKNLEEVFLKLVRN